MPTLGVCGEQKRRGSMAERVMLMKQAKGQVVLVRQQQGMVRMGCLMREGGRCSRMATRL
jgi:hypothetical protein